VRRNRALANLSPLIHSENLITEIGGDLYPELKQELQELAGESGERLPELTNGPVTHRQIQQWYEASGLTPEDAPEWAVGRAFTSKQMYQTFKAIEALNERISPTSFEVEDVIKYEADKALRTTLIKGFMGARAEASRALGIHRLMLKEMRAKIGEGERSKEFLQAWKEATGKEFFQSKDEAIAISKLQNKQSVAQFLRASENRTFGRMAHEYWMCAIARITSLR
jgi:hypothetical protein